MTLAVLVPSCSVVHHCHCMTLYLLVKVYLAAHIHQCPYIILPAIASSYWVSSQCGTSFKQELAACKLHLAASIIKVALQNMFQQGHVVCKLELFALISKDIPFSQHKHRVVVQHKHADQIVRLHGYGTMGMQLTLICWFVCSHKRCVLHIAATSASAPICIA